MSAQLARSSPAEGANTGCWPGLTTYRCSSPARWLRDQVQALSLVMVVQGSHRLRVNRSDHAQNSFQCLILGGHVHMDCEVLEASFGRPYLAVVLEIDPTLVRRVASEMLEWGTPEWRATPGDVVAMPPAPPRASQRGYEIELLEVVLRAGSSLTSDMDRQLLAPLYQHEVVYWLLKSEHDQRLRTLASADSVDRQISAVIDYARTHLTESLSVSEMADIAYLSTSAFAHRFREVTGSPPYQFLKDMRLYRARELLADGDLTVTQVSKQVGYASVSQFTNAFRSRFGVTPHRLRATPPWRTEPVEMGKRSAGTG